MNVDQIQQIINSFSSPAALVFFIPLIIGLLLKKSPNVPDWTIPWGVTVSGVVIGTLYLGGKTGAGVGFIVAAMSVFGHQLFIQTTNRDSGEDKSKTDIKPMLILFPILFLGFGCATVGPVSDTNKDQAVQIVADAVPYIKMVSSAAVKLALQYAETDPVKREDLQGQINTVSSNLDGLLTRGNFSPTEVTASLKVKEKYVSDVLSAISSAYAIEYDRLAQNQSAGMAIDILKALAEGIKSGTNP